MRHWPTGFGPARVAIASIALAGVAVSAPALAQGKLEARYSVTLAGIPLGSGTWIIDIAPDQYTAVASGRTTGLVKLISDGSGSGGSRGVVQGVDAHSDQLRIEQHQRQAQPTKCA